MIPISRPDIGPAEEEAVLEVLRSGMLAMGKRTAAFEEAWAAYCGVRHAILMSNGTVALEAILQALGIGPGDEVITVSFSFNATVSAILRVGATPVFVDVREDDFCIDPAAVEAAITPRTKAILPVHLYGLMADMDPLVEIAERHGLRIVEDAAQAHGATYRGKRAGRFGPAMFSLYATKNLMTGEGGFATTDDDELADRLRLFRNHGMRVRYHHDALGTNFKPTDLAAALGLAQLARLDERTEQRRRNAAYLTDHLEAFRTPGVPAGREHVWHQYVMRFPGERQRVIDGLAERGVGTLIYYPVPIHRQAYLQAYVPGAADLHLPVTDRLADEVLAIPVHPRLSQDDLDAIVAAIRAVATPGGAPRMRDEPTGSRAMTAPAPLRVALAGLGSMGRNHLRVIAASPGAQLVAVGDPDPDMLIAATGQTGAAGWSDPLEMASEAAIDALVIAAPTTAHVPLALAAIERGIPVLVEKPLAATPAEALAIVHAARAHGVPVQVGHVERYNPAVLELGRLLRGRWLTTVYSIASRRAGPFPVRVRDVGVTVDLATHDVDMLCWVAGERPTRVYAELARRKHASHEDLLFGLLHFPSGAAGMIDVNWLTPTKRRQLVVVGEEGMFELDYLTQRLTFTRSDLAHPELIGGFAPMFSGDVAEIPVETHEPLAAQLESFVAAVRSGERPYVDGEDGAWAVVMATALLDAAASRRPVDLPRDGKLGA